MLHAIGNHASEHGNWKSTKGHDPHVHACGYGPVKDTKDTCFHNAGTKAPDRVVGAQACRRLPTQNG